MSEVVLVGAGVVDPALRVVDNHSGGVRELRLGICELGSIELGVGGVGAYPLAQRAGELVHRYVARHRHVAPVGRDEPAAPLRLDRGVARKPAPAVVGANARRESASTGERLGQ